MKNLCFLALILTFTSVALADNPIVQTSFTPDPAAMVHNDTVFVFTGQDEDQTVDNFFTMYKWRVYSTVDMVNYTDHGSPLSYKTFSWGNSKAWAAQAIYRNGKFYWYVTVGLSGSNQPSIGVAVSDKATGPYKDAIGKPLIKQSWDDIDPTVFIDDDGQAYLYWGNPKLYYVKLNEDMISYSGSIQQVPMTTKSFGTRAGNPDRPTTYEEGPWAFKRGDLYYMVFAAGPISEPIGYSTAPSPTGPWTYGGEIMAGGSNKGSFTNHPSVIEYKGKGYFFYHTGNLPNGGGFRRSTSVESFDFGANGSIPRLNFTEKGPSPVATLNPYKRVEAETMAWSEGLKTAESPTTGVYVTKIDNGDYLKVRHVDFGTAGPKSFTASYASTTEGGSIELRFGSKTGTLIGTLPIRNTGGATTWKRDSVSVTKAEGIQDLFLVFKGSGFNLDYWQFSGGEVEPTYRDTILNGKFDQGVAPWVLNVWAGEAQGKVLAQEYCIDISSIGTENYQIQLIQSGFILEQDQNYELLFDAYAPNSRSIEVNVEKHTDPWTSYLDPAKSIDLSATKKTYSLVFKMKNPNDSNSRLSFNVGSSIESLCLDNVQIKKTALPISIIQKPISSNVQTKLHEGILTVYIPKETKALSIELYDLKGNLVLSKKEFGESKTTEISVNTLLPGVYILHVKNENKTLLNTKIFNQK